MPTLYNRGTLFYTPLSGEQQTATSNTTSTTVDVSYSLNISHGASPETFANGDVITYSVVLDNSGSGSFVDAVVTVDLAGDVLDYLSGSAEAFLYNGEDVVAFPVTVEEGSVIFRFPQSIPGGSIVLLTYRAAVTDAAGDTVVSTATVTAREGDESGNVISDSDTATITRSALSIVKSAPEAAAVGDTISFLFTVSNTSSVPVSIDALNDRLPDNFNFTSLALAVNGVNVPLTAGVDYEIVATGELRVDPESEVTIPAGGTAVFTITGVVTA